MKSTDRSRIFEETNPEVFRAVPVKKHSAEIEERPKGEQTALSVRFLPFLLYDVFFGLRNHFEQFHDDRRSFRKAAENRIRYFSVGNMIVYVKQKIAGNLIPDSDRRVSQSAGGDVSSQSAAADGVDTHGLSAESEGTRSPSPPIARAPLLRCPPTAVKRPSAAQPSDRIPRETAPRERRPNETAPIATTP